MNVLVACHCKHTHDPVYLAGDITAKNPKYYNLYDADELAEAKKIFGIANVDYIEKRECKLDENQHREWNKLPRKYDIIVSVYCPVYGIFSIDSEYKYIDFMRSFYKDVKNNLKSGGFFHLPYNLYPKSWLKTKSDNESVFKHHNSNKHLIKVMRDILGNESNYTLEIVDYKHRARIPFFIDTQKNGIFSKNSKSTFRQLVLSFPPKSSKRANIKQTKKHSSKIKTRTHKTKLSRRKSL
jgi:hypothetical protein